MSLTHASCTCRRALEKTQRELDRERTKLENQEKRLIQEIRTAAKNSQMGPLKIKAKDLVRTRRTESHGTYMERRLLMTISGYISKFYQMRTQLQAISLRIQVRFAVHAMLGFGRLTTPVDSQIE